MPRIYRIGKLQRFVHWLFGFKPIQQIFCKCPDATVHEIHYWYHTRGASWYEYSHEITTCPDCGYTHKRKVKNALLPNWGEHRSLN